MTDHAILPLDRRLWWPETYADDEMPEGTATPAAWLRLLHDGTFSVGDPDDGMAPSFRIAEGQVVHFIIRDDLGQAVVTIGASAADDTWSVRPPDDATVWCEDEYEMLGDGPDDFLASLRSLNDLAPGERITVNVARWIDHAKGIPCRFTALDGPPRFIALSPVPEVGPALPAIVREEAPDLFASPAA